MSAKDASGYGWRSFSGAGTITLRCDRLHESFQSAMNNGATFFLDISLTIRTPNKKAIKKIKAQPGRSPNVVYSDMFEFFERSGALVEIADFFARPELIQRKQFVSQKSKSAIQFVLR